MALGFSSAMQSKLQTEVGDRFVVKLSIIEAMCVDCPQIISYLVFMLRVSLYERIGTDINLLLTAAIT